MPWVYIVQCSDKSYYTGSAIDLEVRIEEHQRGTYGGYTASRRPVKLVFCQETKTIHEAFLLERQIKGWSRAKKEAIITGQWERLPHLSKCRSKMQEPGSGAADVMVNRRYDESED